MRTRVAKQASRMTAARESRRSRSRVRMSRVGLLVATLCVVAAALAQVASAQSASPTVYHCPTSAVCANTGATFAFAGPTSTIELFIAPGSNPTPVGEEVCLDGSGDEICGFTLEVIATDDLSITNFTPNMSAGNSTEGTEILAYLDPTTNALRISRVNGLDGDAASLWLGTLTVANAATSGEIRVDGSSEAVSANLQLVPVEDNGPIAVPEPSFALGALLTGGSLLVVGRTGRARARNTEVTS